MLVCLLVNVNMATKASKVMRTLAGVQFVVLSLKRYHHCNKMCQPKSLPIIYWRKASSQY